MRPMGNHRSRHGGRSDCEPGGLSQPGRGRIPLPSILSNIDHFSALRLPTGLVPDAPDFKRMNKAGIQNQALPY
jgi:hypothetical protein